VSENRAIHPVATLCRVLGVSSSGYYAWSKRRLSRRAKDDAGLIERIGAIHAASKGTYGAPRIHAELKANGIHVGKKRVARLMCQAGLAGVSRRRFVTTTVRDGAWQAPDLVERDFTAERPNMLWVADITLYGEFVVKSRASICIHSQFPCSTWQARFLAPTHTD
jgi:putative transposase